MKLGLDLGSSYTKGVLVNQDKLIESHCVKTSYSFEKAVEKIL